MAAARIGLLGGSFDPPHLAHLALARVAMQALALDELRWLPAGAPWQKAGRTMAPTGHRVAMLTALLADEPRQVVDERELRRSGPTFTIDTVRELQAERPGCDWFFILGQDQYGRFDTWRDWRELLQRLTLAVAARAGHAPQPPAALAALPHRVVALPLPRLDISATEIRARAAAGQPVAALVGEPVARYIARHHLYTPGADPGHLH
ncbi:MAG: nicotinate (nicotinamide) nucleotide adenylyltransferase [Burkholderiaceae bacterium]|nr:nicotinate (nicotinamide) nucleotide adenylyltransferase [Burkholderiaceae bacterium]